jgi:hypothetical protein
MLTGRLTQEFTKPFNHRFLILQPAFPENGYLPPKCGQRSLHRLVPSRISHYLFIPVGTILGRDTHTLPAIMPMPKASMHEDDFSEPSEDDVRISRKILTAHPKPEPQPMGQTSH